jgi:MFS family permease
MTDLPVRDALDLEVVGRRRPRVSTRAGFWVVAYLFAVTMLGTTLPTPLYGLYESQWHFGAGVLTVVFSSYAGGVLVALLLAGRASDQVGRRPVLAAALGFAAASTVVFILAPDLGWLFVGRVLSGLSAGLVTGTATAALTDTVSGAGAHPRSTHRASVAATVANLGGLGLGPLLSGLLAQFAPRPTVLVFEVHLVLLAVAAVALLAVPETVTDRSRLSLHFRGLVVPAKGRAEFLAAGLAGFAAFSLLGLFTSLVPTFLSTVLHEHHRAVAGAVVFLVFAVSAVTQVALSTRPIVPVVQGGLGLFLAALALVVAALSQASFALFLVGTVVSGVAAGAAFMGSLATANRLAPPDRRGQAVSTFFVLAYVGLTVPVIGVGVASQQFGEFRPTLVAAIVLATLAVVSVVTIRRAEPPKHRDTRDPNSMKRSPRNAA